MNDSAPLWETLTLGQLITSLEGLNQPDAPVQYDWDCLVPTTLASYRMDYSELCLGVGWCTGTYGQPTVEQDPTVGSLLIKLHEANGKTFEGWKGGYFTMSLDTPVYAANSGNPGMMIVGVLNLDDEIILATQKDIW